MKHRRCCPIRLSRQISHAEATRRNSNSCPAAQPVTRYPTTKLGNTSYQAAGRLEEAISLFERSLGDYERVLGRDHLDTLTSRSILASAYQAAGRLDEAIPLFERSLADLKRVLGPDHLYALTTRSILASAYKDAGRLDEAQGDE